MPVLVVSVDASISSSFVMNPPQSVCWVRHAWHFPHRHRLPVCLLVLFGWNHGRSCRVSVKTKPVNQNLLLWWVWPEFGPCELQGPCTLKAKGRRCPRTRRPGKSKFFSAARKMIRNCPSPKFISRVCGKCFDRSLSLSLRIKSTASSLSFRVGHFPWWCARVHVALGVPLLFFYFLSCILLSPLLRLGSFTAWNSWNSLAFRCSVVTVAAFNLGILNIGA